MHLFIYLFIIILFSTEPKTGILMMMMRSDDSSDGIEIEEEEREETIDEMVESSDEGSTRRDG